MPGKATEQRKLVAIMFTDMVGYSALAQRNEALALDLLEEHRKLVRPLFTKHGGREIKTIGDAFMVEFASPVEAARCAIAMQRTLHKHNESASPERQVRIRVGLHLGDVIHRDNDVYGDGVNIAARIEPLAEPGGICLTQQVFDHVHNKLDAPLHELGQGELKNISVPVTVYRVVLPWEKRRLPFTEKALFSLRKKGVRAWALATMILLIVGGSYWRFAKSSRQVESSRATPSAVSLDKLRLVVLPLKPLSADPESTNFAGGMTDQFISTLGRLGNLRVIDAASFMKARGERMEVSEIGRELNAGHVFRGSVQKAEGKVRIILQLIETQTQVTVPLEEYDGDFKDIFAIQRNVAQRVADALKVKLLVSARAQLDKKPTENLAAFDHYLNGKYYYNQINELANDTSIELFETAISLDTNFVAAYAGLAQAYAAKDKFFKPGRGWDQKAREVVATLLKLDDNSAEAYAVRGDLRFTPAGKWDWKGDLADQLRALELSPNLDLAHERLAFLFNHLGHLPEAERESQIVLDQNPENVYMLAVISQTLVYQKKYAQALPNTQKFPSTYSPGFRGWLGGTALFYTGKTNEALAIVEVLLKEKPEDPVLTSTLAVISAAAGQHAKAVANVNIAKKGETKLTHFHHAAYQIGAAYALMRQPREALEWLKKAADEGFPCHPYFASDPNLENIRNDPSFKAFLQDQESQWRARQKQIQSGLARVQAVSKI